MKKKYIIEVDESEIIKYWNEQAVKEIGYQEYCIKSCPNIKVKPYEERPQGEWIGHIQYCKQHNLIPTGYELFMWCNRCNCPNEKKTKFCPNCGAKLIGSER